MSDKWSIGLFVALVVVGFTIGGIVTTNTSNAEKASKAMRVVATAPLQVTVETPDGQRLDVASSYPKVSVGWYVTLRQNSEGGWEIDDYWKDDPR